MEIKEALKVVNEALNLANSKGVFGDLKGSSLVNMALSTVLNEFKDEVEAINKELAEQTKQE